MSFAALLIGILAVLPQESSHPWGRFKPGSTVRHKLGEDREVLVTLKEFSPKGVVLQQDFFVGGKQGLSNTDTEPLGQLCFHCDPTAQESGKETLKIDGKEYACTVYSVPANAPQVRVKKVWIAKGVDVPVRISDVMTAPIAKSLELVAVKVGEELIVGGKKIRTVRLEGKAASGGKEEKTIRWLSADVPGGRVKMETTLSSGEALSQGAIAFEAKR